MPNFAFAMPELFLLTMACIVLLVDLFVDDVHKTLTYTLTQVALLGTLYLVLSLEVGGKMLTFDNTFIIDPMASLLKAVICGVVAAVLLYSKEYLCARQMLRGEYYVLGLFATLGMLIMVSAYSFLSLYLGLELLSLSLYAMVAFDRDSSVSAEAAMKYFILGALASGMLLYGISIIYGITGSLGFVEVSAAINQIGINNVVAILGLSFIVVGVAFKLGAVPFHMWVPDVYHGAPTVVTLFIGTAPKVAAFAMAMRILAEGLGGMQGDWQMMLVILAVLSLAVGNIVAIAQTNLKRMLAYSTISHVGFILLGLLAGTPESYASAMFYSIVYAIMTLGAFGMIVLLSRSGFEADKLEDFKGLSTSQPWFALMMLILMFSMAGVPPLVGFHAKLAVLRSVVQADMVWLAIVAVLFSVIGAFYYLRIIKLMYFDEAKDTIVVEKNWDMRFLLSANSLAVLGLGVYPSALMTLCVTALAW